jgi:uncharacterized membrane protein
MVSSGRRAEIVKEELLKGRADWEVGLAPVTSKDVHPHGGWTQKIAIFITEKVGTMWMALAFAGLALISLPAAIHSHDPIIIVAWVSQAFLQLVLLPIILLGQSVSQAHSDARAEADFTINQKSFADTQLILKKLDENTKLTLKSSKHVEQLVEHLNKEA